MNISKRRQEVISMYKKDKLMKRKAPRAFRRERDYIGVATRQAVENGVITKKATCELCNNHWSQLIHHPDYNKPFTILWVCIKCQNKWHRENKAIQPGEDLIGLKPSSYYRIGLERLKLEKGADV